MESKLEREVRVLKAYALVATFLCAAFVLSAFALQGGKQKFEEIEVERINVIEKDGQVKLVISNKDRIPGPGNIVSGKFYTRAGPKTPGILFYNEKGDECGGLQFGSKEQDGKYAAGAGLAFDKYGGDQVIGINYSDDSGARDVGFNVWDQPDVSPDEQKKNFEEARKMKDGPERDALRSQAVAHRRVFVGRSRDKASTVTLFDSVSRPRIRMFVGPDGEPKLEFLDASGKITQTWPASRNASNK